MRPASEGALSSFSLSPEGLIIDDYFSIGAEGIHSETQDSFAFTSLEKARKTHDGCKLEGSPEKFARSMKLLPRELSPLVPHFRRG